MMFSFTGNRTTYTGHRRRLVGLTAIAGVLALSGCAPEQQIRTGAAGQAQRQQIYDQLVRLEASLGSEYPGEGLPIPDQTPREWVRSFPFKSAADFENARVARLKAFQELADLAAPEEDATDFSAFWEIHAAYRRAVDMARLGQGRIDLVYSRPYPVDHLSGPQLEAFDTLNALALSGPNADFTELLARQPEIANDIQTVRRRLDFDEAGGLIPPVELLKRLIDDINASPYRSEAAHAAWIGAWRNAVPAGQPRSEWANELAAQNMAVVLPEMILLRDKLASLLVEQAESPTALPSEMEFYHLLIRQLTSGRGDGIACYSVATRQAEETEAQFWDVVQADWNAHIPPPPAPEGVETFEPPVLPVNTPQQPYAALVEWSRRAPLFLAAPQAEPDPATLPDAEPLPPATEPVLPPAYVSFEAAYANLSSKIAQLSDGPLPLVSLSPVLPPAPPPPGTRAPAQPAVSGPLFSASAADLAGDISVSVSTAGLEASAPSASMIELLRRYYPGHAFRAHYMKRREDVPELARNLSTLAYDLGWPYFALETLQTRRAFAESPQLEAAFLYDRLVMFAEAEAEAGFMTGELTEADTVQRLVSRLGITPADAKSRIDLFRAEPGLACAALEGYSAIDSFSERARTVLSTRFNIRAFNEEVLSAGSRPLDLIERDIDDWIATQVN